MYILSFKQMNKFVNRQVYIEYNIYICINTHTYIHAYIHAYIHTYIRMHASMLACMHGWISASMYVDVYMGNSALLLIKAC